MRIAPVLLPHIGRPSPALWADAALAGMLTHNERGSTAACIAFTGLLWDLLGLHQAPDAGWWLETLVGRLARHEGETRYVSRSPHTPYTGTLWRFTASQALEAHGASRSVRDACDSWYSGAYLLETVPCVLYTLMRHGEDPEQAIIRAVNDTRDNDTVAALVGAAVGALHGARALPRRWIAGLLGRTAEGDDGRVFELVRRASARWG